MAKDVLNEIAEGLNDDEVRMEYGEELAKLVTRDSMIGVKIVEAP